jgi:hypothetical protein
MKSYINYFSAVSACLINAVFISIFCKMKYYQYRLDPFNLSSSTGWLLTLNKFNYILPLVVAILGFYLLKKKPKWLKLYWYLSIILSISRGFFQKNFKPNGISILLNKALLIIKGISNPFILNQDISFHFIASKNLFKITLSFHL